MNKFAVIVNVGSGLHTTERKVSTIRTAFKDYDLEPKIFLAHDSAAVLSSIDSALEQGCKIIVAAGGDGTVNAVATKLLGTDSVLGVLPMGTFNHLAKDLGIPTDLNKAVGVLVGEHTKQIDVGQVNDHIFLNNSSIGLYPRLVRYREEQRQTGLRKAFALWKAIAYAFYRYHFLKIQITVNGVQKDYRTPFVFIGNNKFHIQGLNLGARTSLDSGKLFTYVIHRTDRLGLLVLAWHALKKTIKQHSDFDDYASESLVIHSKKKFVKVAIDGEVIICTSPLQYKILPKALTVITPN
jgi:YegS/Rv2252/BmrU family lipid kinase